MRKEVTALIVAGLIYSLTGFAYLHSTFPTKDVFSYIVKQLDKLERDIDEIKRELRN